MRLTLVAIVLLTFAGHGVAQDPFGGGQAGADPFGAAQGGGDPFGGGQGAAGQGGGNVFGGGQGVAGQGAVDPFGGGRVGGGAVAPGQPAEVGNQPKTIGRPIGKDEQNPAVAAIRDMDPQTPTDLMFAVQTLFDIGRADEAKYYLIKLINAKPAPDSLVQFYGKYGESFFLRLRDDHRMTPEGDQFARAVLDSAYRAARDPARIQALVQQLSSESPTQRFRAIEALRHIEFAAVSPLLAALADPARAAEHASIRTAIPEMGEYLLAPMLGALETPNESLRIQVIETLGRFRSRRAIALLVGPYADPDAPIELRKAAAESIRSIVRELPSQHQIERFLERNARDYFDGMLPGPLDYQDQVTLWGWDSQQNTAVPHRYDADEASELFASRLARDLYKIAPDNASYRRLFLLTNLERAKNQVGLDHSLVLGKGTVADSAAETGVAALEDVLSYAMEIGNPVAATGAAELLGQLADPEILQSSGGQPRPLAQALRHGDRRLRLAAAEAILQIDPQQAYAGSSYLPELLGYAIRTIGSRRALVAHPQVEKAQSLVGLLLGVGFEADSATTGREAFRLATKSPDFELVLISDALSYPAARETIQMFRKDPRTSGLAIGLMGRLETLAADEAFAETDPLVLAFPRPLDNTGIAFQCGRLLRLSGKQLVSYDERLDQAARSLDHLLNLANQSEAYGFYDLQRQTPSVQAALATPQLAAKAAELLGRLGSPEAQRSLVNLASQRAIPLAERQAAVKALADAIGRHGLLLTRDEILLQYERYNESEFQDASTQQVLGSILDVIEAPSKAAKTQSEPDQQAAAAS